jgi:5-methylcytosine-specific restriction protein A
MYLFDMANAPKKIQRSWVPQRKAFEREHSNQEFYNSSQWRRFAKVYKRMNPLCVECEKNGIVTAVYVADHIKPINQGGERYDEANIQSLCETCHNRKSGSERG